MRELSYYASNYATARQQFRQFARRKKGILHALPVDKAQDLFIDVAWWPGTSDTLIVHTTGLHGVEAFPGSAVQCAFLDNWHPDQLAGKGLALVHCINPFGMQHLRRWNADNIDLNRNFLTQFEAPPPNPAYDRISTFLNPTTPQQLSAFAWKAVKLLIRHRFSQLQQATAQGQYCHPRGLFFGGDQRATEAEVLVGFFRQHSTSYRSIRGIDFHTGLGKYGQSSFYLEAVFDEDDYQYMTTLLDEPLIHVRAEKKQSYQTQGGFIEGLKQLLSASEVLIATHEIGTVGPIRILKALREENFAYHYDPDRQPEASRLVKHAFCPEDKSWRTEAVRAGVKALYSLINATGQ